MEQAFQNVSQHLGTEAAQFWRSRFERVQQMPGANRKFRHIADAPGEEQLHDYLAEVRYALIFAGLGFQVEIEPRGEKGPDLAISRDSHSAIVEITRFRPIYQGPPVVSLSDEVSRFEPYGDIARDIKKAFEKILAKFPQVGNEESIIAIWNDERELEEIEVEGAVQQLYHDAALQILSLPNNLSFVLYGSNWKSRGRQLYCYPLRVPPEPHQANWISELECSSVAELIQRALG